MQAHHSSSESAFRQAAYGPTVEWVQEMVEQGTEDDIPTPVLEIKANCDADYDEGRSRGVGADEAGLELIPLWIAVQDYK